MVDKPRFGGEKVKLGEVLAASFSGEWGSESGDELTPVLRTANFNDDGSLDYSTPAMRCIPKLKVEKKALRRGDVILEKSGGAPNRPVGMVAYYESDGLALCSNFNQTLRFDGEAADSRYMFYQLRWLHDRSAFAHCTRKTTGLQNLQMKAFVNLKVKRPPIQVQAAESSTLHAITELVKLQRAKLSLLDALVKSRFVEMFGGALSIENKWDSSILENCVESLESGKSPSCKNVSRKGLDPGVLKLSALSSGRFLPGENKAMLDGETIIQAKEVKQGDILVARKNTPQLVGSCVLVREDVTNLMFPDIVFRMHPNDSVNGEYLAALLSSPSYSSKVRGLAHGSNKSMSNIPKSELAKLSIPLPPLSLQQEFADFVAAVDKSRFVIQQQIDKLQTLYDSLAQEYFA